MKDMSEAGYILGVKIQRDSSKKFFEFISRKIEKENVGTLSNE